MPPKRPSERFIETAGLGALVALSGTSLVLLGPWYMAAGALVTGYAVTRRRSRRMVEKLGLSEDRRTKLPADHPVATKVSEIGARAGLENLQTFLVYPRQIGSGREARPLHIAAAMPTRDGPAVLFAPHTLELLNEKERDAVIAHEIAHLGHRDFRLGITAALAKMTTSGAFSFGVLASIAALVVPAASIGGLAGLASLFAINLATGLIVTKRKRVAEFRADRGVIELKESPDAVFSALEKIESAMLSREKRKFLNRPWVRLLMTHPSNRVRRDAMHRAIEQGHISDAHENPHLWGEPEKDAATFDAHTGSEKRGRAALARATMRMAHTTMRSTGRIGRSMIPETPWEHTP